MLSLIMNVRTRKVPLLAALAVLLYLAVAFATEVEFAPMGSAPLLNGRLGPREWEYPNVMESGWDKGHIWIKKDSLFLYLCIAPKDTLHSGLDLYIDNMAGKVFMLHVSTAHGQRFLIDSVWEEIDWGPAELWTSNLVQTAIQDGQEVTYAPQAFEFQISRKLVDGETFKLMLHLKRPELWVPEQADTLSSAHWYWYGLDRPTGQ